MRMTADLSLVPLVTCLSLEFVRPPAATWIPYVIVPYIKSCYCIIFDEIVNMLYYSFNFYYILYIFIIYHIYYLLYIPKQQLDKILITLFEKLICLPKFSCNP